MLGLGSYRTAWSMCHRVRVAMGNEHFRKLIGFVEVEETFVGGKARAIVTAWRRDYNERRPHSAIGYLTPAEYGALHRSSGSDAAQNQEIN